MKKILYFLICLANYTAFAQDTSHSLPSNILYQELANPVQTPLVEWSKMANDINVSFADDNVRYPKEQVPKVESKDWVMKAWKGERVHTQILVWAKKNIKELNCSSSDLVSKKGNHISSDQIKASFVRYVMTDEFGQGCGRRKSKDYDSSLVEEPIDIVNNIDLKANTVQPVWLSIQVPENIPAGEYSGTIIIKADKKFSLKILLTVADHILPQPSEWKYDLDLWQSPNPIAAVHDVKPWSDEHFTLMKSYFTMLGKAGQKVITANIINQPWGREHTHFEEKTLINWTKEKDGSWYYDYSIFDRYIEMMMDCGIRSRINCYSMVTWNLTYWYFDEASGETKSVTASPGSNEFNDFWIPMLTDFTQHLKQKGWFAITTIAMDERNMESMKAVAALLKQVDKDWKTSLAGRYHPEIAMDIYDYCVIVTDTINPEILKERKAAGLPTTYYSACEPQRPNAFTFTPPAETVWISWFAAAKGYTGYLRWAYNNWTAATLLDTRWRSWPAGDCYQIYPGPRSSIRFEKLIEGIQDFEKVRIVRTLLENENNKTKLKELDDLLATFDIKNLDIHSAAEMIGKGKVFLNGF